MRVSGWGKRKQSMTATRPDAAELPGRAWRVFDVINAKIEQADVKAGAILGACGLISAILIGVLAHRGDRGVLFQVAVAASGVLVLMTAAFSCGTLWPRRLHGKVPDNLLYFDHIARRPSTTVDKFEDELRALLTDSDVLTGEIIKQVWTTSKVAARKYDLLDRAMICLFGSLVTLGAAAVIFALLLQSLTRLNMPGHSAKPLSERGYCRALSPTSVRPNCFYKLAADGWRTARSEGIG